VVKSGAFRVLKIALSWEIFSDSGSFSLNNKQQTKPQGLLLTASLVRVTNFPHSLAMHTMLCYEFHFWENRNFTTNVLSFVQVVTTMASTSSLVKL
jgi:hypothetical protein